MRALSVASSAHAPRLAFGFPRILDRFSLASFDVLQEAVRDEKSEWGRLNREATKFIDIPIGAEFSSSVYRPLTEAVIWDVN